MNEEKTKIELVGTIIKYKTCTCCGEKFFGKIEKRCPVCGRIIENAKSA